MLVVRASYAIDAAGRLSVIEQGTDQRFLSAETFAEGDDDRVGGCIFPSDFAEFKLNAEVFFKGHCHVAGGVPLSECLVRFAVGSWSKTLRVLGRRAWSDKRIGAVASTPLGFTSMPISWANAFGGPEFADNPAGKGFGDELPNIEYPHEPIRNRSDRPAPAGFGPIAPAWPARASKMGTVYGKSWKDKRAPFYAEDFDWSFFSSAPRDQQISGYLRGDEEIVFQNLHATTPTLQSRLPEIRVRAFVHDVQDRFREIPMSLDTLLADLDRNVLELSFRGVTEVREHDLEDVRTLLIASEQVGEKPKPESHYRDILWAFEKDPVGLAQAMPADFADVIARSEAEKRGEPVPLRPDLDPISARVDQKLGKFGAPIVEAIGKNIAAARGKANENNRSIESELTQAAQAIDDTPPAMVIRKPGVFPPLGLRGSMRTVLENVERIKKILETQKVSPAEREQLTKKIAELEAVPYDDRWTQLDPAYRPPTDPISNDQPGPGKNLSEQDLTGRNLRGLDLRKANLEGAILTRADLTGADLSGANLRDAVLYKTILNGAQLISADLRRANLARVRARNTDFAYALLETAFFEDAVLDGSNFSKSSAGYAVFVRAQMANVRAENANFDHADFTEANLENAAFGFTSLLNAQFSSCRGVKAQFVGAYIEGTSFNKATLSQASFADTRGNKPIFEGANLDDADISHAELPGAFFSRVSGSFTSFICANLPGARFYKAKLENADATRANLFQADFSHATVSRMKFVKANLYESNFTATRGQDANFLDANLKRSTLEVGT
jgi:uncharacterized protein YjbI with pentapeptide repeats